MKVPRVAVSAILVLTVGTYPAPALAATASQPSISDLVAKSYAELFEVAPTLELPRREIEDYRRILRDRERAEERELDGRRRAIDDRIRRAQDDLKDLNRNPDASHAAEDRRHELHCMIQLSREQLKEVELARDQGVSIRYENLRAKLDILQDWPERYLRAQAKLADGRAAEREFGDFRDVGFRGGPFEGQEEDLEKGREAIEQLKRQDLLPPEVEDEEIVDYIRSLAGRIARHSDLRIPLNVSVLKSEEINAFALPGGYLFINSGLIDKAGNESELAGVVAHEIAHIAARHSNRLMGRANIANIIFQAAQVAALILTGGVGSLATYYLLQYSFFGLGMVLSLSLLGVSREFEIESDILGTQYLWHANYDTRGFVNFFGRMAEEAGYVTGMSWFRTHPPFAERMTRTFEEIVLLPEQEEPILDSADFRRVQERLREIIQEMKDRDRDAPTLRRVYDCEQYEEQFERDFGLQGLRSGRVAGPGSGTCPHFATSAGNGTCPHFATSAGNGGWRELSPLRSPRRTIFRTSCSMPRT
jgi:beta-barrel assembly-enhancing protease